MQDYEKWEQQVKDDEDGRAPIAHLPKIWFVQVCALSCHVFV